MSEYKSTKDSISEFFITSQRGKIYNDVIDYVEKMLIEKALERSYGNQAMTAKVLGLNRNTLHSKIIKLNIDPGNFKA